MRNKIINTFNLWITLPLIVVGFAVITIVVVSTATLGDLIVGIPKRIFRIKPTDSGK